MPTYNYIALENNTKKITGQMEAANSDDAAAKLKQKNLIPLNIEEAVLSSNNKIKLKTNEVVMLTRQLATLTASGMPLDNALLGLIEQTQDNNVKHVVRTMHDKITQGFSLDVAMEQFPKVFSKVYCATISAGQLSGRLDLVLEQLADYSESQQTLKKTIKQALIYPTLVISMSVLIVSFLMYFVVPKMAASFEDTGQALPTVTIWLVNISKFIQNYGLYFLVFFMVIISYHIYSLRNYNYRKKSENFISKIPLVGETIALFNATIFFKTLNILTSSGVAILEAVEGASKVVNNIKLQEALVTVTKQISEGVSMSLALKKTQLFTPMSIYLLVSGEATGNVVKMLKRIADMQQRDIQDQVKTVLSVFEPIMILVMGAIILCIVLAVLLPLYSIQPAAS